MTLEQKTVILQSFLKGEAVCKHCTFADNVSDLVHLPDGTWEHKECRKDKLNTLRHREFAEEELID